MPQPIFTKYHKLDLESRKLHTFCVAQGVCKKNTQPFAGGCHLNLLPSEDHMVVYANCVGGFRPVPEGQIPAS